MGSIFSSTVQYFLWLWFDEKLRFTFVLLFHGNSSKNTASKISSKSQYGMV